MGRKFCPEEDCGFQLIRVGDSVYCPACGWSSEIVNTAEGEESVYVEQAQ